MISDFLNPIVVKELRQGLKSRSFIATFIGLQVAMVFSMIFYFIVLASPSPDLSTPDGFFWFMLGLMLLVFMPLRAFQAIHEEIKGNTLEMLFLTRMTAWDISFGKWTALGIQVGLLVCAVMPYLVLRYFLGSVDIFRDLLLVALQTLCSLLLVAMAVGLSSWKSKLLRGLLIVGALMSFYLIPFVLYELTSGGSPLAGLGWADALVLLVAAILVGLFFVEYGASQIAPPAENHAFRKRILAVGLFLTFVAASLFVTGDAEPMTLCVVLLVPVFVDALCEPVLLIPMLYKSKWPHNPLRWFFLPGWASGTLFTMLMLALIGLVLLALGETFDLVVPLMLTLFNLLLFPMALIVHIPGLQGKNLAAYFVIQVAGLVLTVIVGMFISMSDMYFEEEVMGSIFPLFGFMMCLFGDPEDLLPHVMMIPFVFILLSVLSRVRAPLRRIQELSLRL